jgi:hypothetical protein
MTDKKKGRPYASGSESKRYQISIPPGIELWLRGLGNGSLSGGIVKLARDHVGDNNPLGEQLRIFKPSGSDEI